MAREKNPMTGRKAGGKKDPDRPFAECEGA